MGNTGYLSLTLTSVSCCPCPMLPHIHMKLFYALSHEEKAGVTEEKTPPGPGNGSPTRYIMASTGAREKHTREGSVILFLE